MCQTVDEASVNVRIGELMGKPAIVCNDHLLQSEFHLIVAKMLQLKQVLIDACANVRDMKSSMKN